jgi:hypothetical protein
LLPEGGLWLEPVASGHYEYLVWHLIFEAERRPENEMGILHE